MPYIKKSKMNSKILDQQGFIENEKSSKIFESIIKKIVDENKEDNQKKIDIYCALCNVIWYNIKLKLQYSCSWRYAGGLIARYEENRKQEYGDNWNYLNYYCSGNEGIVKDWIEKRLKKENWFKAYYMPI